MANPPVKFGKLVIGDGTMASGQVFELLPAVRVALNQLWESLTPEL
jgi:hypothetical protein